MITRRLCDATALRHEPTPVRQCLGSLGGAPRRAVVHQHPGRHERLAIGARGNQSLRVASSNFFQTRLTGRRRSGRRPRRNHPYYVRRGSRLAHHQRLPPSPRRGPQIVVRGFRRCLPSRRCLTRRRAEAPDLRRHHRARVRRGRGQHLGCQEERHVPDSRSRLGFRASRRRGSRALRSATDPTARRRAADPLVARLPTSRSPRLAICCWA